MELHTDQYCLFECVHFWLFPLVCLPGCCVNLVLNCQVKEINAALERKVREEVMKVLDQRENEYLPQVILDTMEVSMKVADLSGEPANVQKFDSCHGNTRIVSEEGRTLSEKTAALLLLSSHLELCWCLVVSCVQCLSSVGFKKCRSSYLAPT